MLKRDLSYELFSREPEDLAEWAGFAREYYTAKREPSPGNTHVSVPVRNSGDHDSSSRKGQSTKS